MKRRHRFSLSTYAGLGGICVGVLGIAVALFYPQHTAMSNVCPWLSSESTRYYTNADLKVPGGPVMVAVGGWVLDVSTSSFFTAGGAGSHMAGMPCTRALALRSTDPKDVNDEVGNLSPLQQIEMEKQIVAHLSNYRVLGQLSSWQGVRVHPKLLGKHERLHSSMPGDGVHSKPPPEEARLFTAEELSLYNGTDSKLPLVLAVGGVVFDVNSSAGYRFYGPQGPYHAFAGQPCTRGIVLPSLEEADISDDLRDFSEAQMAKVDEWVAFFSAKYKKLGLLRPETDTEQRARIRKLQQTKEQKLLKTAKEVEINKQKSGRVFTSAELRTFDGRHPDMPLLMAVSGHVLDVTPSKAFYGPGGPRHCYAGRAVTRALTLQSTEEKDLNDDVSDFSPQQLAVKEKRVAFSLSKFAKVGQIEPNA